MLKKIKAISAFYLLLSVISVFVFVTPFSDFRGSKYSFEGAKIVNFMSTEYSQYAIATDGTLLKRINFYGIISDFLVRFIENVPVFIPLDNVNLNNKEILSVEKFVNSLFGGLFKIQKSIWGILFMLTVIILFICTWGGILNEKFQELLSNIAMSREWIWIKNISIKLKNSTE